MRNLRLTGPAAILIVLLSGCQAAPASTAPPAATTPPTVSATQTAPPTTAATATAAAPNSPVPAALPTPLIVDTDLSVDDIVALAYVLGDPSLDVQAITVSGTGLVHCSPGLRVARSIAAAMGRPDVWIGCGRTSAGPHGHPFPEPWRTGADSGYGVDFPLVGITSIGSTFDAPALISQVAMAAPGPVAILGLGPMTNVADALAMPDVGAHIGRVVAMAGAFGVPGNVFADNSATPLAAEWNVYADPDAADVVVRSGIPMTFVPLDSTNQVPVTREFVDALERDHGAAGADIATELFARYGVRSGDYLWDALAAVVLTDPSVAVLKPTRVAIDPATGVTRESANGSSVEYASTADAARFQARLLVGLRTGAQRSNPFVLAGEVLIGSADGTCSAVAQSELAQGKWRVTASTTDPVTVMAALVRLHAPWTWQDLENYVEKAPDPTTAPHFVDVITTLSLNGPGTASDIVTLTPGSYVGACLTQTGAKVETKLAAGTLDVPPT